MFSPTHSRYYYNGCCYPIYNCSDFEINQLTGTLPSELGQMTKIEKFYFRDNLLSGSIPSELGLLAEVSLLAIDTNPLTSSIPMELCTNGHSKLAEFTAGHSAITGTLPADCFLDWPSLARLEVEETEISGTIPTEVGLLVETLTTLNFANTSMIGSLPMEVIGLSSLESLNVEGTMISGIVPPETCQIPNLRFDCTDRLCGCNCTCGSLQ